MNTSKDNLEFQIKKQMEEREIEPSRDLWSEIELQNGNNHHSKSRLNWFLVAACIIIVLGLGSFLFFSIETPKNSPKMAKETERPTVYEKRLTPHHKNIPSVAQENHDQLVKNSSSSETKENIRVLSDPKTDADKMILKEPLQQKKPIAIPYADPKIIAQADTLKSQVKKKQYVDPETLLFSVEHKDIIEKTKGKSNVATIDLNGK